MSLIRLVLSESVRDSREALAAELESPPPASTIIKDEPRTLIHRISLPAGMRAVVKTYRRRSLYDFSRESLTRFRVQREFDALSYLSKNRVACARPVCWACGRDPEWGRYESLVTVEEHRVTGLKAFLRSGPTDDRWIEPAAGLVRQGHDLGFYHGALAPRNILIRIDDQPPSCFFIDTPKSIVFPRPVTGTRMATHDLMVFLVEVNNVAGERAVARFLKAYGVPEGDIPDLVDRVGSYRANRNTRNRKRAEFLLRRLVS